MKLLPAFVAMMFSAQLFAQSKEEADVIGLSKQMFVWEVDNKLDSLENLFDKKMVVVGSSGESQSKEQYIARLGSGNFKHNSIEVEENNATVVYNTAVVVGKGNFSVTVSGNNKTLHLSYMEVFTRTDDRQAWKLLALYASILQR